jgi:hypothetical protein
VLVAPPLEPALPVTAQAASSPRHISALRYLDVAVIVVGALPALLLGAPAFGYVVGAVGWIVQRVAQNVDRRLTARVDDPVRRAGVNLFESFGRIWLLAAAIIIAAVAGQRADGLTSALVIFAAYSIAFTMRLIDGASAAASIPVTPAGLSGPEIKS